MLCDCDRPRCNQLVRRACRLALSQSVLRSCLFLYSMRSLHGISAQVIKKLTNASSGIRPVLAGWRLGDVFFGVPSLIPGLAAIEILSNMSSASFQAGTQRSRMQDSKTCGVCCLLFWIILGRVGSSSTFLLSGAFCQSHPEPAGPLEAQ